MARKESGARYANPTPIAPSTPKMVDSKYGTSPLAFPRPDQSTSPIVLLTVPTVDGDATTLLCDIHLLFW